MLTVISHIALAVLIYVSLFWLVAYFIKNWSIIDSGWGPGFVVIGTVALLTVGDFNIISLSVFAAVVIWALRLSLHIGIRNAGQAEDFRYQNWRKKYCCYLKVKSP